VMGSYAQALCIKEVANGYSLNAHLTIGCSETWIKLQRHCILSQCHMG
jgi:hypothetical protein